MADVKVSALPELASGDLDPAADFLLVSDMSASASKKMKASAMIRASLPYLSTFWDFTIGSLLPTVSFTRASTGWRFNSSGVLVPETTDVARFQYDPATLVRRGLLIEQAATNVIRNSSAAGAVAGTPGTAPTYWSINVGGSGITREIVGSGTEDGIPYIDIRYSGTPSTSSSLILVPDSYTNVAAAVGQVWTGSWYFRLMAGSWTNVGSGGVGHYVTERDNTGTTIASSVTVSIPTNAPLRTQRSILTRTFVNASVAYVTNTLGFAYTNGLAIDFTLRIGLPQLVQSDVAHSPIPTTGTAVAKAADTVIVTNPQALADRCFIIKARTASFLPVGNNVQMLFCADDGSTANRLCVWRGSTGNLSVVTTVAGATSVAIYPGVIANDTDFSLAVRFADANSAVSLNGGAILTDMVGVTPLGLTTIRVGRDITARFWNSTIKTFETRRTATDAELPLLAA